MTKEKTPTKNPSKTSNYVRTFREGAVAANVFQRVAVGGFEYLDFSISRAWKTPGGKEGYSQNFFSRNRDSIHKVVDEACDFIADGEQALVIETKEAA